MLKRRALILFLVAVMLALPVVASAADDVIKDDTLKVLVRNELDLKPGAEISKKLLKQLENLEIRALIEDDIGDIDEYGDLNEGDVVKKLDGLEYATDLETLILTESAVKDLDPLKKLDSLRYLEICKDEDTVGVDVTEFGDFIPTNKQMRILQDIQHAGAVVRHPGPVNRISGEDRYETAVRVFQNYDYEYGPVNAVVLARGDVYADALAGAPLALSLNAPILLTTPDKLHKATKNALVDYVEDEELNYLTVYVLGGQEAVSNVVVNELRSALAETDADPSLRIERIAGEDRYETAVEIADMLGIEDEVYFASGENYPDALAAAPYAAAAEIPILLTRKDALPECVVEYFKDLEEEGLIATVIGGKNAVSTSVYLELGDLQWKKGKDVFGDVERISGKDRYATAVELATELGPIDSTETIIDDDFFIATGENFADALTGAVLAAAKDTGILLVKGNSIPKDVKGLVEDSDQNLTILGGETAVSRYNAVELFDLLPAPEPAS